MVKKQSKKSKNQTSLATRALEVLNDANVNYELIEYEHSQTMEHGYALDTSSVLGIDPALIFKTLMTQVDAKPVIGVVPASGRLNLKSLAKAVGGKHAEMMDPAAAQRVTGYVTGGISPLGQLRSYPMVIDASAQNLELMIVSAGKRSLSVSLAPNDLAQLTSAIFAPISTQEH